jgi:hypothetical protein
VTAESGRADTGSDAGSDAGSRRLGVPEATVGRLPLYHRVLVDLVRARHARRVLVVGTVCVPAHADSLHRDLRHHGLDNDHRFH